MKAALSEEKTEVNSAKVPSIVASTVNVTVSLVAPRIVSTSAASASSLAVEEWLSRLIVKALPVLIAKSPSSSK